MNTHLELILANAQIAKFAKLAKIAKLLLAAKLSQAATFAACLLCVITAAAAAEDAARVPVGLMSLRLQDPARRNWEDTGPRPLQNTLRPEGFIVWWQRTQDLRVVLDALLADPLFGPRIDAAGVGVAGFSIGGQTALALVGARVDSARYSAACATQAPTAACSPPPEARTTPAALRALVEGSPRLQAELARMDENFADSRVKAAFAIAPALAGLFSEASLAAVPVPVQMVTGSDDDQVAPASTLAAAAAMPQASAQILPGVTHYAFITPCNAQGQRLRSHLPICVNPPGLDRASLHRQVAAQAVAFFNRTLPSPTPSPKPPPS